MNPRCSNSHKCLRPTETVPTATLHSVPCESEKAGAGGSAKQLHFTFWCKVPRRCVALDGLTTTGLILSPLGWRGARWLW